MSDQWLSIVEYARYFNLSDMTVRRRIKTGKLRAVLKDGKYYIPLKHEGFAASAAPPTAPPAQAAALHSDSGRAAAATGWSQTPLYSDDSYRREASPAAQHGPGPSSAGSGEAYGHAHRSEAREQQRRSYERPPQVQRAHIEVKPRRPPLPAPAAAAASSYTHQGTHIPPAIAEPLSQQSNIMLESKALLNFCEGVIARLNESEKRLAGDFENKVAALEAKTKSLEAQLSAKEVKLVELQQQVEDLQLLVQIIEKQKPR